MTTSMTFLLLRLALLTNLSFGETGFSVNSKISCNNGVSVSVSSIDCGGHGTSCALGDTLDATGTMVFSNDMPETADFTYDFCLFGVYPCRTITESGEDFCNKLGLSSESGEECPSAGTYSFDVSIQIPTADSSSYGYGWWVGVKTTIAAADDSGAGSTVCSNTVSAISVSTSAAVGVFLVTAAVAAVLARKRRRVAKIDLLAHESAREATTGHFEMMKDTGVVV